MLELKIVTFLPSQQRTNFISLANIFKCLLDIRIINESLNSSSLHSLIALEIQSDAM